MVVVVWGENLDGSWVGAQKVTKVWRGRRLCVARGVGSLGGAVNDGRARLASLKPGCRAIGPWAWVEMPARKSGGVVGANKRTKIRKRWGPRALSAFENVPPMAHHHADKWGVPLLRAFRCGSNASDHIGSSFFSFKCKTWSLFRCTFFLAQVTKEPES